MSCEIPITRTVNTATGVHTWVNQNAVDATVTSIPAMAGFPLMVPAGGSASGSIAVPDGVTGEYCVQFMYECGNGVASKTVSVTAPDGPYSEGDTITHTVTIDNTGTESLTVTTTVHGIEYGPITVGAGQTQTQTVDYLVGAVDAATGSVTCDFEVVCESASGTITETASVTSTVNAGGNAPVLLCPPAGTVITDPNYVITWIHNNPLSTTVNYDPRVNGADPGPSVTYPATTFPVNLASYVGAGTSGTVTIEILYWYDGDTGNIVPAGTCDIEYDFTNITINSNLITCDQARLDLACDYEQLFCDHYANLYQEMDSITCSQIHGGQTGCDLYFFKPMMESTARMYLLACEKGNTANANKYKNSMMSTMQNVMTRWLAGNDVPTSGGSSSKYQYLHTRSDPITRQRLLSISRGAVWFGYAIWAIRKSGKATAADDALFNQWDSRIKDGIDWVASELNSLCQPSHGGFGHMPSHIMLAMAIWDEICGTNDYPQAAGCLNTLVSAMSNGDPGSDTSHNADTVSNMSIIRDMQLCGNPITPIVTDNLIQSIGNHQANAISNGASCTGSLCQSFPNYVHLHALTVGCSSAMQGMVPAPTLGNYSAIQNPGSAHAVLNPGTTVPSAAWGYAQAKDNEVCP